METLEQPRGMPSEHWIKILLTTAAEVANGIALSEEEERVEGVMYIGTDYSALSNSIQEALANPVLS